MKSNSVAIAALVALCGLAAMSSASGVAPGDASSLKSYRVMVFSKPLEGREAEYNAWYDGQHVPDMLAVSGFEAAQRFHTVQAATPTSTLPPYLVIYDVATHDLDATNAEVMHRMKSGELRKGEAIDYPGIVTVIFAPLGPPQLAKHLSGTSPAPRVTGHDELKTFELMVFSNPVANREEEYNHWYDTEHVPDVLHVPGFVSGQRFKLAQNASPGTDIPGYLMRFVFKSYDLDATIAEILRRIKSGETRMSTAMAPQSMVYFDALIGRRVKARAFRNGP